MIGGCDVVLNTRGVGRLEALDICARIILQRWRSAVFQSGTSARVYDGYGAVPWGSEPEILVYRDRGSLEDWERSGAHPGNADAMFYLLAYEKTHITVVVGDVGAKETAELLVAMKRTIRNFSTQLSPLEIAA